MTFVADFVTGKPVPFSRERWLLHRAGLAGQEGVMEPGDLKVAQRAAGANMSVDVAAGDAWIDVDSGVRNGRGHVLSDAVYNAPVGASHATLPRVDRIVLQWNDSAIPAGVGGDDPTIRVIAGVATAGATLDNENGIAAMPNDALQLATVLVPAASTSVVTANIRDRRKWARGANGMVQGPVGGSWVTSASTWGILHSSLSLRMECSGVPLDLEFALSSLQGAANVAESIELDFAIDGVQVQGATDRFLHATNLSAFIHPSGIHTTFTPAAGSHVIDVRSKVSGANYNVGGRSQLIVRESIRPFATNT